MTADYFVKMEPTWVNAPSHTVAADAMTVASTVRIRRNINGFPFPGKCSKSELYDSAAIALGRMGRSPTWSDCDFRMIDSLDPLSRYLLVEKGLITPQFAQGGAGRFLLRDMEGTVSCMINEEDHISISSTISGLGIHTAMENVRGMEDAIGLDLANDTVLGYLTANPAFVGSGLTASVLLHLPALDAANEMPRVMTAFERDWKKLAFYRLPAEKNQTGGSFFMLSNKTTLTLSGDEITNAVYDAAQSLASKEHFARHKMQSARDRELGDRFWRAWGLLRHARKLTYPEAIEAFSFVKLGSELGVLPALEEREWRRMMLGTQKYHLTQNSGQIIEQQEEPYVRATAFRQFIEGKSVSASVGTVYHKEL